MSKEKKPFVYPLETRFTGKPRLSDFDTTDMMKKKGTEKRPIEDLLIKGKQTPSGGNCYLARCCLVGPKLGKTKTFDYFRMMSLPTKKERDAFWARKKAGQIESDRPEYVDMTLNMLKKDKKDPNEPQHTMTIRVWDIVSNETNPDQYKKFVEQVKAGDKYELGVAFVTEECDVLDECEDLYLEDLDPMKTKMMVGCQPKAEYNEALDQIDIENLAVWVDEHEESWALLIQAYTFNKTGWEEIRSQMIDVLRYVYDFDLSQETEVVQDSQDLLKLSKSQWEEDPQYWIKSREMEDD